MIQWERRSGVLVAVGPRPADPARKRRPTVECGWCGAAFREQYDGHRYCCMRCAQRARYWPAELAPRLSGSPA